MLRYVAESGEICLAAGFDRETERHGHLHGVTGNSYGRIYEDGIGAHFHGFGCMGGSSQTGINHHGNAAFLYDYFEKVASLQTLVGTYGCAKRHHCSSPDFLQPLAEDGIGLNVR